MRCGNQDSIVRGSSPHKCGQEVWWNALNVVEAIIPSVTSEQTPSVKLFLYSVVPPLLQHAIDVAMARLSDLTI